MGEIHVYLWLLGSGPGFLNSYLQRIQNQARTDEKASFLLIFYFEQSCIQYIHHNRKVCACNNIFTVSNILSFVNTLVFYNPLQLNLVRKSLYKKTSMYLCISSAHLWKVNALGQLAILTQTNKKG